MKQVLPRCAFYVAPTTLPSQLQRCYLLPCFTDRQSSHYILRRGIYIRTLIYSCPSLHEAGQNRYESKATPFFLAILIVCSRVLKIYIVTSNIISLLKRNFPSQHLQSVIFISSVASSSVQTIFQDVGRCVCSSYLCDSALSV